MPNFLFFFFCVFFFYFVFAEMDSFCRTIVLDKHHCIMLENVTKETDSDFHKVGPHRAILGSIEDMPTQWRAPEGYHCVGHFFSDEIVFQSNEIVNFLDTLKKLDEDGSIAFFDPFTFKRLDQTVLHAEHGIELSEDETASNESEEEEEEEEVSLNAGMEMVSINADREEMEAEDPGRPTNSSSLNRVNEWMAKYPEMFEAASAQKPDKNHGEEPRVVFMLPPNGDYTFVGKLNGISYFSITLEYNL